MDIKAYLNQLHLISAINFAIYDYSELTYHQGPTLAHDELNLLLESLAEYPATLVYLSVSKAAFGIKIGTHNFIIGWKYDWLQENITWQIAEAYVDDSLLLDKKFLTIMNLITQNTNGITINKQNCHVGFRKARKENSNNYMAQHNSFKAEQVLFQTIMTGDVAHLAHNLENFLISGTIGTLHKNSPTRSLKNIMISAITVYTRAAILGGVPQEIAFRLSDTSIQNIEASDDKQLSSDTFHELALSFTKLVQLYRHQACSPTTQRCLTYLDSHLHYKITLADIAQVLHISISYLTKNFKKDMHLTISQYLTQLRLERAEKLLAYSTYSIAEIAQMVGIPDQNYFTKLFKKQYQQTPLAYRQENQSTFYD